jgi:phage gp45-like
MKTNTQIGSSNLNGGEVGIFNNNGQEMFIDAGTEVIHIEDMNEPYAMYETKCENIKFVTLKKNISL